MRDRREDSKVAGMQARNGSVLMRGVWPLTLACVLAVSQVAAIGATMLPGLRAPLLDTPATPAACRIGMSATTTGGLTTNDAEIEELARGLKYDPGLMYKFVHDHIKFELTWGEVKGPYMTWMDRSGNAFDQAALMVALLEKASDNNTEYTIAEPDFVVGEIQLSASEAISWLDIPNDVTVAKQVLARAGLYGTVTEDLFNAGKIDTVNLEHVWVKVTIDSTDYEFDPSFKTHTTESGIWNLYQAMGFYQGSTFLANATNDQSNGLNMANIDADLTEHSGELVEYIKDPTNNLIGADLVDIIGGRRINDVNQTDLPPSSLPYTVVSNNDDTFDVNNVPEYVPPYAAHPTCRDRYDLLLLRHLRSPAEPAI